MADTESHGHEGKGGSYDDPEVAESMALAAKPDMDYALELEADTSADNSEVARIARLNAGGSADDAERLHNDVKAQREKLEALEEIIAEERRQQEQRLQVQRGELAHSQQQLDRLTSGE